MTCRLQPRTAGSSDVLARLGLKATALAWPGAASALKNLKPGHEPKPRLALGPSRLSKRKMMNFACFSSLDFAGIAPGSSSAHRLRVVGNDFEVRGLEFEGGLDCEW